MGRIFLIARHPNLREALTLAIETQSRNALRVVGSASWDEQQFSALAPTTPDVIVLIVGIDAGSELRSLERLRALAPGSKLLIVDTLGDVSDWRANGLAQADALIHSEHLATELVPAITRLLAQRGAANPETRGGDSPRPGSE